MILWEVATCSIPYKGAHPDIIKMCVKDGQREELPEGCPNGYVDLIQKCWHQDTAKRPTITEILDSITSIKQGLYVCSEEREYFVTMNLILLLVNSRE